MGLTVRERKALADIEQALAEEDPRLARQLERMRPSHRAQERTTPAAEPPAAEPTAKEQAKDQEQAAKEPAVPKYVWENEPGTVARRVARWCVALALVLLVVAGAAASREVLYAAGATTLVSLVARIMARSAARRA